MCGGSAWAIGRNADGMRRPFERPDPAYVKRMGVAASKRRP